MRCSAWSSLATSVCRGEARLALAVAALVLLAAPPAAAHIVPDPAFVRIGATDDISLTAHNDRDVAMDGFTVTVPEGMRVVGVEVPDGWEESTSDSTARWTGGPTPPGEGTSFVLDVEASGEPGAVTLDAAQVYADDRTVEWPVTLTVVPGDEATTSWTWLVIGGVGVLLVAGVAVIAWRRRSQKTSAKNA